MGIDDFIDLGRLDTNLEADYFPPNAQSKAHSIFDWVERIVSKELENLDGLSKEQLLDLRIATLQKLDAALSERLGNAGEAVATPPQVKNANEAPRLSHANSALALAIPEVLATFDGPRSPKNITKALLEAGREFESDNPVHSVRTALKKMVGTHPDIFHVGWSKWWLKSKCGKGQLDKYLAKNARFGTGGHSKKEHSRRTSDAIRKRIAEGQHWGPKKATPELLERAREMLRKGVTLTEVCRTLDVATPTLYQYGIRQRALKEEGKLRKEQLQGTDQAQGASPDELRARGIIPLHARVVGEKE